MANHKSASKRVRADQKKRLHNRYQHKTAKTFIKGLSKRSGEGIAEALSQAASMLDKLAKRRIIHPNKSARKKSQLARRFREATS